MTGTDDQQPHHAPPRQRLPNRRQVVTVALDWGRMSFLLSVGFDRDGRAREVFIAGSRDTTLKAGSELQHMLEDACVLVSLALQSGHSADDLTRRLGGRIVQGEPAETNVSFIRVIAEHATRLEADQGDALRASYEHAATIMPKTWQPKRVETP